MKLEVQLMKQQFSQHLKAWIDARSLTSEQLAERMGFGAASIENWLAGDNLPSHEAMVKLCNILRVTPATLLRQVHEDQERGLSWEITDSLASTIEIQKGVELFRLLMHDKRTVAEIQRENQFRSSTEEELARMLRAAFFSRAVHLVNVDQDRDSEKALHSRFVSGHSQFYVAKVDAPVGAVGDVLRQEAVAWLAVRNIVGGNRLDRRYVGITGGSVIARFADLIPYDTPALSGTQWVSLVTYASPMLSLGAFSSNSLVTRLVYNQPGTTGYILNFVDADHRLPQINKTLDTLTIGAGCDACLISLGSRTSNYMPHISRQEPLNELLALARAIEASPEAQGDPDRHRFSGDLLLALINRFGQRIGSQAHQAHNDALRFGIELHHLAEIATRGPIWILASRTEKTEVITAALYAGYTNSLVVTSAIAKGVLDSPVWLS
jgi:transcriptional regulator with XRE-family HTH domain